MSFADAYRPRSPETPYQALGVPAGANFSVVKKEVRASIKAINEQSTELGKLTRALESGRSVPNARERVYALINATRERARSSMGALKLAAEQATAAQQADVTGVQEELRATLASFHTAAESASHAVSARADLELSTGAGGVPPGAVGVRIDSDEPTAPLMAADIRAGGTGAGAAEPQHQQLLQQQELAAVQLRQEAIEERADGIAAISQSVREVHEIFTDLALLVHEQGTQIDNIQTNVENATTRVQRGVEELQTASRHQKRYRGRLCTLAALAVVGLLAFVAVLKFALGVI